MQQHGELPRWYWCELLDAIEDAAVELGRAQAEGKRGRRERKALEAAEEHYREMLIPVLEARRTLLRYANRRLVRALAALILVT